VIVVVTTPDPPKAPALQPSPSPPDAPANEATGFAQVTSSETLPPQRPEPAPVKPAACAPRVPKRPRPSGPLLRRNRPRLDRPRPESRTGVDLAHRTCRVPVAKRRNRCSRVAQATASLGPRAPPRGRGR
jgi:hypothetical protein